jgi:hypothetical protein
VRCQRIRRWQLRRLAAAVRERLRPAVELDREAARRNELHERAHALLSFAMHRGARDITPGQDPQRRACRRYDIRERDPVVGGITGQAASDDADDCIPLDERLRAVLAVRFDARARQRCTNDGVLQLPAQRGRRGILSVGRLRRRLPALRHPRWVGTSGSSTGGDCAGALGAISGPEAR